MKKTLVCLSAMACLGASSAFAADDSALTANVTLASKYKYRGQDQSDSEKAFLPAIQGGFDYTAGGFYVGNWNSSVGFGGGTEVDLYGGYKGDLGNGLGYDVGVLQYYYPALTEANTTELYGAVTFGPLLGKLSYTASKKYFGIEESRGTMYFDVSLNQEIATGLTFNAHVGATRFTSDAKNAGNAEDYIDYKVGVTYDLGSGFSLAGAVVGANKKNFWGDINKTRAIVSITKAM